MVAAVVLKHILPYIALNVCGTVSSALDSDIRDFVVVVVVVVVVVYKQQVSLSSEGQSHIGLYTYRPGTCTATCI